MKDIELNIKINAADAANTIGGIKKSIKDLNNAALAVGQGGKGFDELTKKAGELKNKLGDLNETTNALNGSGVEKLTAGMNLLKESFTSANPEKMAAGFKVVGTAMKAIPIFLIIEGIKFLIENFEKLTQSGGLIGKVFGFIKDIIDGVIQAFKDLTDWLGLTNNAIEDNANKTIEAAKKTGAVTKQRYDDEIALAKAAGESTFELEIKKQKAVLESAKVQLNALKSIYTANGTLTDAQKKQLDELLVTIHDASLSIKTTQLAHNKEMADDTKNKNEDASKSWKEKQDKINKLLADSLALQKKLADDAIKQRDDNDAKELAATAQLLTKKEILENQSADKKLALDKKRAIEEIDALFEKSDRSNAAYQASVDAKIAIEEKYSADVKAVKDKAALDVAAATKSAADKAKSDKEKTDKETLDAEKKKNEEIIAGINSVAQSVSSVLGAISDYNSAKAGEAVKVNEEALNTQLSSLETSRTAELNVEGLTSEQKDAINQKYNQQKYELEISEYNKTTEIKKKAFEQDKKFKIAQVVISTITGAISAVTGMISAIPGPVGIILGALAGAAVAVSGGLAIAKIKASTFDAGAAPTAPTVASPNAGASLSGGPGGGESQLKKIGSSESASRPEPSRVYVVSTDLTNHQNADGVLTRRANFTP